jgi:hypothetical protein
VAGLRTLWAGHEEVTGEGKEGGRVDRAGGAAGYVGVRGLGRRPRGYDQEEGLGPAPCT